MDGSAAPAELDMAGGWRLDEIGLDDGSDYHVKFWEALPPRRAAPARLYWAETASAVAYKNGSKSVKISLILSTRDLNLYIASIYNNKS